VQQRRAYRPQPVEETHEQIQDRLSSLIIPHMFVGDTEKGEGCPIKVDEDGMPMIPYEWGIPDDIDIYRKWAELSIVSPDTWNIAPLLEGYHEDVPNGFTGLFVGAKVYNTHGELIEEGPKLRSLRNTIIEEGPDVYIFPRSDCNMNLWVCFKGDKLSDVDEAIVLKEVAKHIVACLLQQKGYMIRTAGNKYKTAEERADARIRSSVTDEEFVKEFVRIATAYNSPPPQPKPEPASVDIDFDALMQMPVEDAEEEEDEPIYDFTDPSTPLPEESDEEDEISSETYEDDYIQEVPVVINKSFSPYAQSFAPKVPLFLGSAPTEFDRMRHYSESNYDSAPTTAESEMSYYSTSPVSVHPGYYTPPQQMCYPQMCYPQMCYPQPSYVPFTPQFPGYEIVGYVPSW
jgi:hypothetical protein